MSDLEKFNELVDDIWELVFGTERRPKPKRATTKKGTYRADDPKTKDYNEAYVGGKEQQQKIDNRDNLMKKMLSNSYDTLMNE